MKLRITGADTSPSRQSTAERERRIRWRERLWRQNMAASKEEDAESIVKEKKELKTTCSDSEEPSVANSSRSKYVCDDIVSQRTTRSKEAWMKRSTRSQVCSYSVTHYNGTLMDQGKRHQRKEDRKEPSGTKSYLKRVRATKDERTEGDEKGETKNEAPNVTISNNDIQSLKVNLEDLSVTSSSESGKNSSGHKLGTRVTRCKSSESMKKRLGLDVSNVVERKRKCAKLNDATKSSKQIRRDSQKQPSRTVLCKNKINSKTSQVNVAKANSNSLHSLKRKKSLQKHDSSNSDSKISIKPKKTKSESKTRLKQTTSKLVRKHTQSPSRKKSTSQLDSNAASCSKTKLPTNSARKHTQSASRKKSTPQCDSDVASCSKTDQPTPRTSNGSFSLLIQSSLPPAPPNIKWKTSSMGHLVKEGVKELGGRCSFMDLLQYMRSVHEIARNALFVLHAVQVAVMKKMIFIYDNRFVTKEMLKVMQQRKKDDGGKEDKRGKSSERCRVNRYSYRILKNQLLKASDKEEKRISGLVETKKDPEIKK